LFGGAIREDTSSGKIFVIYSNYCSGSIDSTERVLYDYTLNIGDTVRPPNYCGYNPVCWVIGIDSTTIDSRWYKIWHFVGSYFGGPSIDLDYYVIEGIGSTNGYYFPIDPYPEFEHSEQLTCFSNSGSVCPLSNPVPSWGLLGDIYFDDTSSCLIPTLSTSYVSTKNKNAVVFPNPINETSKIVFPYSISSGSLVILNDVGQVVKSSFQNKEEVLVCDKIRVPGIYIYRVTDNESGKMFTGKFVY
jgi:hypothetical protein